MSVGNDLQRREKGNFEGETGDFYPRVRVKNASKRILIYKAHQVCPSVCMLPNCSKLRGVEPLNSPCLLNTRRAPSPSTVTSGSQQHLLSWFCPIAPCTCPENHPPSIWQVDRFRRRNKRTAETGSPLCCSLFIGTVQLFSR